MRKFIAILCTIALCVTTVVPSFGATSSYEIDAPNTPRTIHYTSETHYNPYYPEEKIQDVGKGQTATQLYGSTKDIEYVGTIKEAGAVLREGMTKRKKTIEVYYEFKSAKEPNYQKIMNDMFNEAQIHTGKSNEGDALKWGWHTWDCSANGIVGGTHYYLIFTFELTYYTTLKQEQALISTIKNLKKDLNLSQATDLEKVEQIYNYICENVVYDYEHLDDDNYYLKFTDYAALINGTSVCQGYTLLFYRLALEHGLDARVHSGIGNGVRHSWNIVKLGDLYYYLDPTWDAVHEPDQYFLKGSDTFVLDHTPYNDYRPENIVDDYLISQTAFDGVIHKHQLGTTEVKAPTCEQKGKNQVVCAGCHYKEKTVATPAAGHSYGDDAFCDICGKEKPIPASTLKTVKLSKSEYVYNGEQKNPTIIIKDKDGNSLSSKYYTVTKPSGRKKVGKYTYTIQFKDRYEGEKTLTLTVKPKATSIQKVTAEKNGFTVKWSKISSQATGYQIMYATNSKFTKGKKTVKVASYKTTSKKISKLSTKKTYYVKVRTYKTVNGVKIYSAWSKVSKVKTK